MKDGVITDENRIIGALPTIKYLMEHGAKVVLCSHMGKPHNVFDDKSNSIKGKAKSRLYPKKNALRQPPKQSKRRRKTSKIQSCSRCGAFERTS